MSMQEYVDEAEETLSLSNFHMMKDDVDDANHSSMSTTSYEQDFSGFFTEEWRENTSSEDIVFCGKVVSSKLPVAGDPKPMRSNSDSFRFIRLKTGSRTIPSRSKSMPNRSSSFPTCKSRLMVFMFGSGSSKFPTKVDIKSRRLRPVIKWGSVGGGKEEGDGKKGWWRVVDVLGCNGGYERDRVVGEF